MASILHKREHFANSVNFSMKKLAKCSSKFGIQRVTLYTRITKTFLCPLCPLRSDSRGWWGLHPPIEVARSNISAHNEHGTGLVTAVYIAEKQIVVVSYMHKYVCDINLRHVRH